MSVLHSSREIAAEPQAVFAAIQDPVRLARWWGPAGFTNTFHTFDFREDGSWLFTMHGPDGKTYPNEARFLEIVPNVRVAIRHVSAPVYRLTITLEPATGGTFVSWHCVFENSAFVENARQFLETANALDHRVCPACDDERGGGQIEASHRLGKPIVVRAARSAEAVNDLAGR